MKSFKVVLFSILIVVLVACSFTLVGCVVERAPIFEDTDTATVYIGDVKYIININDAKAKTVYELLAYLKTDKNIHLVTLESTYGPYITEIGTFKPDPYSAFICIYTSVEEDKDVSAWGKSITHDGNTLYTSGLGISSMTFVKDASYLFIEETF